MTLVTLEVLGVTDGERMKNKEKTKLRSGGAHTLLMR